jgi:hypothetical protein
MFKDFSFVKKSNLFFDINYNPYLTDYNERSLPSSWILYQSFVSEQKSSFFEKKTKLLQEKMGVNKTVWGYKINNFGIASWEYYYYHYKVFSSHSIENVLQTAKSLDLISDNFESCYNDPEYYLLSFDFKEEKVDSFSIYYPHILQPFSEKYKQFFQQGKHYFDSRTMGFISYEMKGNSLEESNYYKGLSTPYDNDKEKLFTEIRLLCEAKLPEISKSNYLSDFYLLPFLIENTSCHPWCIAIKKNAVKLYFTNVNISIFIFFIKHFNYPLNFISKIENKVSEISHLKFDFSFEISYKEGDQNLTINNPVIYGTF